MTDLSDVRRLLDVARRIRSPTSPTAVTLPAVAVHVRGRARPSRRRRCSPASGCASGAPSAFPNPATGSRSRSCGEPLIVVRDKEGQVRCLSAVCQHRAMQVCDGQGNDTTFKCPYHHWIYGARRSPARRAGDGAHRGLRQGRLRAARSCASRSGWGSCSSTSTPTPPRSRRRSSATRRTSPTTTSTQAVCPGTFTLEDMPWNWKVMFENFNDGYHANRLHQYVQDFCPSNLSAFPEPWSDDSNVIFRTVGVHPHRRRLQRHPPGDHAGVPRPHRRGAHPFDVRADAADAVLRHGARPVLLLPRPPDGRRRRSTSRSATSSTRRRSTTRCSRRRSRCPTPACRCSSGRTRTPPPRCSAVSTRGSRRVVATRGRRRATCSSTAGSSSAIARPASDGSPQSSPQLNGDQRGSRMRTTVNQISTPMGRRTMSRKSKNLCALLVPLALVAAACGGDDDDGAGTTGHGRRDRGHRCGAVETEADGRPVETTDGAPSRPTAPETTDRARRRPSRCGDRRDRRHVRCRTATARSPSAWQRPDRVTTTATTSRSSTFAEDVLGRERVRARRS